MTLPPFPTGFYLAFRRSPRFDWYPLEDMYMSAESALNGALKSLNEDTDYRIIFCASDTPHRDVTEEAWLASDAPHPCAKTRAIEPDCYHPDHGFQRREHERRAV